ncbi:cell wall-binding repeat-containing protein [Desulfitobacterium metallireducens]|uniref:Vancomycin resistance protein n=1 Tax=Desulfitobacterium metallireducens DSM 15288 TaxID=871968 RepID=W0EBB2_9FIRM|nr:cell wall-binding repeat-containing protein [Desulfitobacterium metallireducens]AHF08052.1 vancomycin resistance protein [Desulfitobacterium metallireducens DSM 15288]
MKHFSRFGLLLLLAFLTINLQPVYASSMTNPERLDGLDRYETAKIISERAYPGKVNSVVLVSGESFANALPASVLASKLNAPIILIAPTIEASDSAFDYLAKHLDLQGNIYLIGEEGSIGSDFTKKLNDMGYQNINRIGGQSKYETDVLIAKAILPKADNPIVISSGEDYPDALSISSFAAKNGWSILLVNNDLPNVVNDYIQTLKPSKIYITGGPGAVSIEIENKLKTLFPDSEIVRLDGLDRFETAVKIVQYFNKAPNTIYLASGYNFPDALAGSVLAAKTNAPILLVDPNSTQVSNQSLPYLNSLRTSGIKANLISFGGKAIVPEELVSAIDSTLNGTSKLTDGLIQDSISQQDAENLASSFTSIFMTYDYRNLTPKTELYALATSSGFQMGIEKNITANNATMLRDKVIQNVKGITYSGFSINGDEATLEITDISLEGTVNGKNFTEHFSGTITFTRIDGKWLVGDLAIHPLH